MSMINDPWQSSYTSPQQAQALQEWNKESTTNCWYSVLKIPNHKNCFKETNRRMTRRKWFWWIINWPLTVYLICACKLCDVCPNQKNYQNSKKSSKKNKKKSSHPAVQLTKVSGLHVSKKCGLCSPKNTFKTSIISKWTTIPIIYSRNHLSDRKHDPFTLDVFRHDDW